VKALRRSALLLAIAVGTLVGLTANPAQAAFADKATMATLTIGTATIVPPGNVQVSARCGDWFSVAGISWNRSSSRDVTGYTVTAYRSNGNATVLGTTNGTTSSTNALIANGATYSFTVTTVTSYGWTAESTRTGTIRC
jgi:hypothetical protein